MKTNFITETKKHMAAYKKERLGLDINGTWNNKGTYSHILPKEGQRMNILEPYRPEFWTAKHEGDVGIIKLHDCFHHLTSSQALCFNLFFPFLYKRHRNMPILLEALGLPTGGVTEAVFEKIPDAREGTAFDFFLRYKDGYQVTFEVKFTEPDFGATKQDDRHEWKFANIYSPMAEKILNPEFREMKPFLKNYQFLRNLIYLSSASNALCLFILPKANPVFSGVGRRLDAALLPEFRFKARIVWLEDIVASLATLVEKAGDTRLTYHLDSFKEKYLAVK